MTPYVLTDEDREILREIEAERERALAAGEKP
jgi:hypothetical protein